MKTEADEIKKAADALRSQLRQDRRYLHRCPEIGTELPRTSAYIRQRLDDYGNPLETMRRRASEKNDKKLYDSRISTHGTGNRRNRNNRTRKSLYSAAGGYGCTSDSKKTTGSLSAQTALTPICAAMTAMLPCF